MTPKITRAEAIAIGQAKYFTGEKCKHGHLAVRYTLSGCCTECLSRYRDREVRKFRLARGELKG